MLQITPQIMPRCYHRSRRRLCQNLAVIQLFFTNNNSLKSKIKPKTSKKKIYILYYFSNLYFYFRSSFHNFRFRELLFLRHSKYVQLLSRNLLSFRTNIPVKTLISLIIPPDSVFPPNNYRQRWCILIRPYFHWIHPTQYLASFSIQTNRPHLSYTIIYFLLYF